MNNFLYICVLLLIFISTLEGNSLRLAPRRFRSSGRSYHDSHSDGGFKHDSNSEDEEIRPNRNRNNIKNINHHSHLEHDIPPMEMMVNDLEVEVDGIPQNRFVKIPARSLRLSRRNHAKFIQNPVPNKSYSRTSKSRVPRIKIKVFFNNNKNKNFNNRNNFIINNEKEKKKALIRTSMSMTEEEIEISRRSHDAAFSIIG